MVEQGVRLAYHFGSGTFSPPVLVRSIRHGWDMEHMLNALAIGPNVPC